MIVSRNSDNTNNAFNVNNNGYVNNDNNVDNANGVRPVFYLKSNITLTGGEGIDGSVDKPYRVN